MVDKNFTATRNIIFDELEKPTTVGEAYYGAMGAQRGRLDARLKQGPEEPDWSIPECYKRIYREKYNEAWENVTKNS